MTVGMRRAGEFCWMNMITPEPAKARAFYATLLGWTYVEMPGMGHRVQGQGRDIGALFDIAAPGTPPGTPSHIGVMIKIDDAESFIAKVTSLGGTTMPVMEIGEAGRMVSATDPNGARFDVWQAKRMTGSDVDSHLHGAPTWFETLTTDVDRAAAFYTALFGWTAVTTPMEGGAYTTFALDGTPLAGMMQITQSMDAVKPHWGTYFAVDDVDRAAKVAVELGATLTVPVRDIPGVGRFCGIDSPQGVFFYLIKFLPRSEG
ncbi:MAG: VOC family protein [Gemmatimonadetes bacterium]|nr:VOC family protein [Gemmatimonadota bacterium]